MHLGARGGFGVRLGLRGRGRVHEMSFFAGVGVGLPGARQGMFVVAVVG